MFETEINLSKVGANITLNNLVDGVVASYAVQIRNNPRVTPKYSLFTKREQKSFTCNNIKAS